MNRMAIVPWSNYYERDELFDLKNESLNRDNGLQVFVDLKDYLNECHWDVHTVDYYTDLKRLDLIVFFSFDKDWYSKVYKAGKAENTVYVAFEPPVVDSNHTEKGIYGLLDYFHYILTWNDAIVDNERIFKFMYPYCVDKEYSEVGFSDKKLLVNISGNKHSDAEYELYSEREKVITYFDENNEFELYGTNWDKSIHPSYKGLAKSKRDVYHRFKYALCLENMFNIDGYITEKILDCFCSGIVPIYLGAKNIDMYIPSDCYIHYDSYGSCEELKEAIKKIDENEYLQYLNNIDNYLASIKVEIFRPENLGKTLIDLSEKNEQFIPKRGFCLYAAKDILKSIRKKIKNKLLKDRCWGGDISIGENCFIDEFCFIGNYTYIGKNCFVTRAVIGRYVSIGNNVSIGPGEHNLGYISTSAYLYNHKLNWYEELTKSEVVIGNDVWIGTDSIIKRGVIVGNGAVIGANSFVNKDVPPFAIIAGCPAKIIRYRFDEQKIQKIINSHWWDYDIDEARKIVEKLDHEI